MIDGAGFLGTMMIFSVMLSFSAGAFILFFYFWWNKRLDMDDEPAKRMMEEAVFTFPAKISARREVPDVPFCDKGIASAISEEQNGADGSSQSTEILAGNANTALKDNER